MTRVRLPSRPLAVALAVIAQVAILLAAVSPRLSPRLFGQEYRLRVAPVDPIDPFRGAYVALRYPDIRPTGRNQGDWAFVPLRRAGELWRAGPAASVRPVGGPYLACRDLGYDYRCGIESLFLPQERARSLERELADGGVARVRIDGSGRAALVTVEGA